jgi:hypothetical protein
VPLSSRYAYALIDLIHDPRTKELYRYRAIQMRNRRYIELYELRDGEAGP